jgi:hypothetical protein
MPMPIERSASKCTGYRASRSDRTASIAAKHIRVAAVCQESSAVHGLQKPRRVSRDHGAAAHANHAEPKHRSMRRRIAAKCTRQEKRKHGAVSVEQHERSASYGVEQTQQRCKPRRRQHEPKHASRAHRCTRQHQGSLLETTPTAIGPHACDSRSIRQTCSRRSQCSTC